VTDADNTIGSRPLAERLVAFVAAKTWDESQDMLEADPELLSDRADAILAGFIEATRDNPAAVESLAEHRALLQRCREIGIEAAFAEMAPSLAEAVAALNQAAGEDLEVRRALEEAGRQAVEEDPMLRHTLELLRCEEPADVIELAGQRPELLADEVDAYLTEMAADARAGHLPDATEIAQDIEARRDTLRKLREVMGDTGLSAGQVAAAYKSAKVGIPDEEAARSLLKAIEAYVNAPDWATARAYVETHPELLDPGADALLALLIEEAEAQGDDHAASVLAEHRQRLGWAREDGPEAIDPLPPAQAGAIVDAVQGLFRSPDRAAARAYVEAHPELLGDEALALMALLIDEAEARGDNEAVRLLRDYLARLVRARDEGLDAVGPSP
jgi:hypothetical protein